MGHSAEKDARAEACDGSRYCAAEAHWHGCFADLNGPCDYPDEHDAARLTPPTEPGADRG